MRRITRTCLTGVAIGLAGLAGAFGAPARAHGPCDPECLTRYSGAVGDRIEVRSRSIRAVLNPRRSQIPYGPPSLWDDRRSGVRARTLYRVRRPRKRAFRVPPVPAGNYVIAIFDGSEGGSHYTWTHFRVKEAARSSTAASSTPTPSAGDSGGGLLVAGAAALVVALLAGGIVLRERSVHGQPL